MENSEFRRPQSATLLASNHIKLGMSPFYPFNCYIPEAFKNRRSSSAENGGETQTVEQLRAVTQTDTAFIKEMSEKKAKMSEKVRQGDSQSRELLSRIF